MATVDLGTIGSVDLREVWPNEASDFTPWLAEHISELGKALRMDLELKTREAPVGGFSLDLLAYDFSQGRSVIIENQLESTNHDHLGKLLTYAAGYDASVVVWIAKEIREEHRQALDWLNQRTDTDTEFFGVVIELLKIDASRPAPNFRLVAFPNEWRKTNIRSSGGEILSERAEAYRIYFQRLIDDLREQHAFTSAQVAQPRSGYFFASGYPGVKYGSSFAERERARVDVYIDRGDANLNKSLFDELAKMKDSLEDDIGSPLEWERLDAARASRIAIYRPGTIDDVEELDEIHTWMVTNLLVVKKVFGQKLAELVK